MSTDKSISHDSIKEEGEGTSKKELIIKQEKEVKKDSEINAKIKEAEKIEIQVDTNEIKKSTEKETPKEINQEAQNVPKKCESNDILASKVKKLEKEEKKKDKKLQYFKDLLKNKFGYVESDSQDKNDENEEEESDDEQKESKKND